MGTRSLVVLQEKQENGSIIRYVVIYEQYDGDLLNIGLKLATFLKSIRVVNGFHLGDKDVANGVGCLAAQYIAQNKTGPGGFYIDDSNRALDEEFVYIVTYDAKLKQITVNFDGKEMTVNDFYNICINN